MKILNAPTFVNSSKLICQSGINYPASPEDLVFARSDGDGVWRIFVLAANALITGTPIVILATGQSNFVQRPAFTWTVSPNVFSWNYNDTDGNVGTAFTSVPNLTINQPEKFASDIARANPNRQVYLIGVAIGSQPISQWLPGAAAPDMWANIQANITPALAAIGASKIDILLWWEGESQTSEPWQYVSNFNSVMSRFQTQSWFPVNTPVVFMASRRAAPAAIYRPIRLQCQAAAGSALGIDTRRFVYSGGLGPGIWQDTLHLSGAGHFIVGELASNVYLHGETINRPSIRSVDPYGKRHRAPCVSQSGTGGNFSTNPWRYGTTFNSAVSGTTFAEVVVGAERIWRRQYHLDCRCLTMAQAGVHTAHCIDVNVTTADSSIASTDYYGIFHKIDGRRSSFLGFGQTGAMPVTISFWVKSAVPGIYYVGLENGAQTRSQPVPFIVDTANTWEKKFITIAGDTTGTWTYGSGVGLQLFFTIATGSQFVFTPSAWGTGDVRAGLNTVNGVGTNGNHFKLALVQVEEGIEPSAFEQLPTPAVVGGLNENDPAGAMFQRTLSVQNSGDTPRLAAPPGASVNTETAITSNNTTNLGAAIAESDVAQPVALATNGTLAITIESRWSAAGTGVNQLKLSQLIVEALN